MSEHCPHDGGFIGWAVRKLYVWLDREKSQKPAHRGVFKPSGVLSTEDMIPVSARPHGEGKVHVTLPCGAKIRDIEPFEIENTPEARDGNQPESVRQGGAFFECYARCPYVFDCTYFKAFADLHIGKALSLPLEHGRSLELKRGNGHRHVALVDKTDVEIKTIPLTGVSYHGRIERYTTVPPLFQDVDECLEDKSKQIHATIIQNTPYK